MNNAVSCSDQSIQLFCGDEVTYPKCFGDKILIFVGMAEQLNFLNDCVVIYNGCACPAIRADLFKLEKELNK